MSPLAFLTGETWAWGSAETTMEALAPAPAGLGAEGPDTPGDVEPEYRGSCVGRARTCPGSSRRREVSYPTAVEIEAPTEVPTPDTVGLRGWYVLIYLSLTVCCMISLCAQTLHN